MSDYQFKTQPYDHQRRIFLESRDREHYALLWEMGVGKSKTLLDTAAWLAERGQINGLLIICWPSSLVDTWTKIQIPAHLPDRIPRKVVGWKPNPKSQEIERLRELVDPKRISFHILVMNVEALSTVKGQKIAKVFLQKRKCLMVVDESTKIKHTDAKRSKAVRELGRLAPYRRIMTGTPSPESPMDIFGQFEFLQEGLLGHTNEVTFRHDFCVTEKKVVTVQTRWGPRLVNLEKIIGGKNLERLNKLVLAHGSRLLKTDCLDLPPKIYKRIYVELWPEQRRAYDDLVDLAVAELEDGRFVTAPMAMTRIMALRQIVSGLVRPDEERETPVWLTEAPPKFGAVAELIEAHPGQAIVFATFVPVVERLAQYLTENTKRVTLPIYGAVPVKKRHEYFQAFQEGKVQNLVIQPQSGGYGVTLTAADLVIYHDNDWSLEVRLQTEDRAHRIGQDKPVTIMDVIAKDTLDDQLLQALIDKDTMSLEVTGDAWRKWIR